MNGHVVRDPPCRPDRPAAPGRAHLSGAAASVALTPVLTGAPRSARALAAVRGALFLQLPAADVPLVAVLTPRAPRLPNAVIVPLPQLPPVLEVDIGAGGVDLGSGYLPVTRWWDPVPRCSPVPEAGLADRLSQLGELLPVVDQTRREVPAELVTALAEAVARADSDAAVTAAERLLGRGVGLTPGGDDVLAGFLTAARTLGVDPDLIRRLASAVVAAAQARTTAVSAALLWHAARGEAIGEVGTLLAALAGREPDEHDPLAGPVRRLVAIGHTSGRQLARGVLAGGLAALAATTKGLTSEGTGGDTVPTGIR